MVAVSNPFGMRPTYSPQGRAAAVGYVGGIASGYGSNILKYQPVMLNSSGNIIAATAGSDTDIIGVFAGITWVDAQGVPHSSDMWTAGTVYSPTTPASPVYAWVWNDPGMIYSIQCDGSLALSVGGQVDFSNITAGSTTTGLSACTANASSLTTSGSNQLRVYALDPTIGNAWGDAFTVVQVQIAQNQYVADKNAV